MEEIKEKKVTVNTGKAVRAYNILTMPKSASSDGLKLGDLDTQDIFRVIRATNALKATATAFQDFQKDAQERLKPVDWDATLEKIQKMDTLSDIEKAAVNRSIGEYNRLVGECVATEVDKDREIDAYEHLSEEAFGKLVKCNSLLLDLNDVILLQELLA